ncbi:2-hydroxyacid dehydrogenase [Erwiniaceae bacterium BAC15a-03b]|uniref:2-hydroxyacid dehydrogenase n=1 Tax=Winslowiella arboricola TaxID=2978220 RepID=A0A9J6PTK0_9GAMM|nr:2-hydroxyacid dehydrogenase [Winslowiella arboricola]MCU5774325.1 2-hydroxyacid dehydrogenase [Winslowiella arboricola]MCU5778872.1 2-hydroxyacid dehydrogenase [Winslowiella arboricola]
MPAYNIDLLIIKPLMPELTAKLQETFNCHLLYEHENISRYIQHHGEKIRAIATRGDVGVDAEIMARLPNLEVISVFGIGTDGIDLLSARERNISVAITADVLTDDVADLALTFILASSRNLLLQDRFCRNGNWHSQPPALSGKVSGKKIGIFGLGKIGKAIARRAQSFNMSVAYCNRREDNSVDYRYFATLTELADFSDFLVLAVPGGSNTQGAVDRGVLTALGPTGTLINISRGTVVNEPELTEILSRGGIKAAALDVFSEEPFIPAALLAMDNVILTPHVGSATHETRQAMADLCFSNLESYFSHGKVLVSAN